MQLVPGTEVAVAPKRRKNVNSNGDEMLASGGGHHFSKALLRVQDADKRLVHQSNVKGVELGVVLTSVGIVHPETAERFSLKPLELVAVVPRLIPKESMKNSESDGLRIGSSTPKESSVRVPNDKKDNHQAVVRLLISDSVAKGHLMIAQSLRLYLRAGLHSCE